VCRSLSESGRSGAGDGGGACRPPPLRSAVWHCDPAEFKQLIELSLRIGDQSRVVELQLDKSISLERAQELARHALSIYEDRTAQLRECFTGKEMGLQARARPSPNINV
jgi:hypothetical protein